MTSPIAPATRLGRYEILSQLGVGGMGEVNLAEDTKLDRKVALKILPGDVASKQERMARFVREAKAAAALNHPNIAHVYEIGVHFKHLEAAAGWRTATQLTDFKTDRIFWFDWSRDGKQLAFVRGAVSSDVVQIGDTK